MRNDTPAQPHLSTDARGQQAQASWRSNVGQRTLSGMGEWLHEGGCFSTAVTAAPLAIPLTERGRAPTKGPPLPSWPHPPLGNRPHGRPLAAPARMLCNAKQGGIDLSESAITAVGDYLAYSPLVFVPFVADDLHRFP